MEQNKYSDWINSNYPDFGSAIGRCKEACHKMKDAFPELEITNGYVTLAFFSDQRTHWWMKDKEGQVIDPTAIQFLENGTPIIDYEEIDDEHDERKFEKARCMNCGEYYFVKPENKGVMHNRSCENEMMIYLNGARYVNKP